MSYPCCEHCPEDPIHDVPLDEHEVPCQLCDRDEQVEGLHIEVTRLSREAAGLLRRLEAVRALLPDADHGARCRVWPMPVFGGVAGDCDCVLADLRAALGDDGSDGAGSHAVPPLHVQESTPRHQVTTHPPTALKSTMGDPQ